MRSYAGFLEGYILTKGAIDEFASGNALPAYSYYTPVGIAASKELQTQPYDPPRDVYNNTLRGRRLIKFDGETFQGVNFQDWQTLDLFVKEGGCDFLLISEECSFYQGDANGIPGAGVIWWRKNPGNGIFFFQYADRSHMGLNYEYLLTSKSHSIKIMLEAALEEAKARQVFLNAITNIVKRDAVTTPEFSSAKQAVTECKEIQYWNGTSWVSVFAFDDINDRTLSIKTVENKRPRDSRQQTQMMEIDLTIVGSNASCWEIYSKWNYNQFSAIRLIETHPNGLEYVYEIKQNSITNQSDPFMSAERRENVFKLQGRCPLPRFWIDFTTRQVFIGSEVAPA